MKERKLNRLSGYDYSKSSSYFITICVKNMASIFGSVYEGMIELNECGCIALHCWYDMASHIGDIKLDDFVIMPNHFHGIVHVVGSRHAWTPSTGTAGNRNGTAGNRNGIVGNSDGIVGNSDGFVGNRHACSLRGKPVKRQHEKLPVIVGAYKSAVSKMIHQTGKKYFEWQKSYYDRIIRNDDELNRIRAYILDNPVNWHDDEYHC